MLVIFIISFIEKIPTIKAIQKDKNNPTQDTLIELLLMEMLYISMIKDKSMIGTLIKKEKLAHSFFSVFANNPALIVVPEREIPGNMAMPCIIPIKIAVLKLNGLLVNGYFSFFLSATNNIRAVNKNDKNKYSPLNAFSTIGIKINAIIQVGIVAITNFKDCSENGCVNMYNISFLKTMQTDISVATCKIIETNNVSSTLKSCPNKTKCPLDETGKNSVNPCVRPKKIKARISNIIKPLF